MSTRCQIGFYPDTTQALSQPDVLLYRHSDGYPQTEHGVLDALHRWARDFEHERGLADTEYAAARGLVALMRAAGALDDTIGYGICGSRTLHGDIAFYYRVDPSGVTVYRAQWGGEWDTLTKAEHVSLDAPYAEAEDEEDTTD